MMMHQVSRALGWTVVIGFLLIVTAMIWVLASDTFTGQGCEAMEFCRSISGYLPDWISNPTWD